MMENAKQKKPRTIQMKYPAPYSHSWADENQRSEPKKPKLNNAHQSGGPLSQSWANERSERADERAVKRARRKTFVTRGGTQIVYPLPGLSSTNERKVSRPRKSNAGARRPSTKHSAAVVACCHMRPRPNPTAPHLKYGLFPPKKNVNKSQAHVVVAPESKSRETKSRSSTAEHSSRKEKTKGQKEGQGEPLFVFRGMEPRCSRQLSVSPPAHLDIRPRARLGLAATLPKKNVA